MLGLGGELRIHGGVLVGLAFDGEFEAAAEHGLFLLIAQGCRILDHQLRMQQAEMGKSVFRFLGGGIAEQLGQILVTQCLGYIGEEQVFAVGHTLATKSGLEIGLRIGFGEIHAWVSDDHQISPNS